ncbi:hypothetical protein SLEP1_g53702 [Rubroshorea leprosula]|uniref:Uncharacterized protein n=1 Tax=Rubroshorea leprosula TaxID=152421 RepID=A0AAV5MBA1_9ROSI|nr:hypothetical protein SLEP1_g53702 [Rubroshorea leprosula]
MTITSKDIFQVSTITLSLSLQNKYLNIRTIKTSNYFSHDNRNLC